MALSDTALSDSTDDELVARSQDGDRAALEALISRYRSSARARVRSYFLVGGDRDDVEQEALVGLYKAVRDYRPGHRASFRGFAELCITRQILTAVKTATRMKHRALDQYVSLSAPRPGSEDLPGEPTMDDVLPDRSADADPADRVLAEERMERLRGSMADLLSGLEAEVLRLHIEGRSYREIGDALGRRTKSIDNALQRIKRKLDRHLAGEALVDGAAGRASRAPRPYDRAARSASTRPG